MMPEETEEIKEAKESARGLCEQALTVKIETVEQFNSSAEIVTAISKAKKRVQETFKPMIEQVKKAKSEAEKARKEAVSLEEKALKPFEVAGDHLKRQRLAFQTEQDRLRRIEEQKAREKAEREAKKEAEKLLKKAVKQEENGNMEKAEEFIEQAEDVYVEPVAVAPVIDNNTKTDNGTVYTVTDLEVILPESPEDIIETCRAIVEGNLKTNVVQFSKNRLKQFGKAMELTGKHYGIVFKETKDERVR